MYKKSDVEKAKSWFETVNNMGQDIAVKARDEYDTFLEKCLEPYGITKENAYRFESRVRMEEENPHIEGFETVIYQRFYIDNKYEFTVVFKQTTAASGKYIGGIITTYEKVVEQDRLPKEEPMTNKEAIGYIKRIISGNSKPDMALKMAIEALEEQDRVPKGNAMTATKAIGILETVRGMSANSDEEEAFNKAIEALKTVDLIEHYQESINKQKETGTVILPWYCDALFVPKDMLIKIIEGGSGYAVEKEDMYD